MNDIKRRNILSILLSVVFMLLAAEGGIRLIRGLRTMRAAGTVISASGVIIGTSAVIAPIILSAALVLCRNNFLYPASAVIMIFHSAAALTADLFNESRLSARITDALLIASSVILLIIFLRSLRGVRIGNLYLAPSILCAAARLLCIVTTYPGLSLIFVYFTETAALLFLCTLSATEKPADIQVLRNPDDVDGDGGYGD